MELENKTPSISGLATTPALTAVENKISYVSSLVKETEIKLKRKSLIIIIMNILLLQNFKSLQQKFLMQD